MKIKYFCPRWGFESIPWEVFVVRVKEAGYAGIEWFPYSERIDSQIVLTLLQQQGLELCIVMTVTGVHNDIDNYLIELRKQLLDICSIRNGDLAPLFISAQTGREYYTEEQIDLCLACCAEVSREFQIPIYHETHRNKWAYAAHVVLPVLKKHPNLLLTLDISHWFCVSESYLEDQQEVVEMAVVQARHIHARVGHIEGPQVYEPSSPEYAETLEAHLKIWDKYIKARLEMGAEVCTITPEFGPPPYMVFEGRIGSAQQEQWRLNCWMKDLLENRYS